MKHINKAIAICLLSIPLSMAVQAAEHEMGQMGGGMQGMQGMGQHAGMGQHEGMQGAGQGMQHGGMGGMGGMHGDMMDMSPEHLKEMQAHMLIMHDLSNKILAEKDPAKQQALKDQQLLIMKAHIADRMAKHHKMQMPHPAPEKK
jgi:hypothetical protein